jgi:hypothetical protein
MSLGEPYLNQPYSAAGCQSKPGAETMHTVIHLEETRNQIGIGDGAQFHVNQPRHSLASIDTPMQVSISSRLSRVRRLRHAS